jgi:hypothetical protein
MNRYYEYAWRQTQAEATTTRWICRYFWLLSTRIKNESIFSRFIDISCECVDGADMYRKRDFLITSQATGSKNGDFLSHPNHVEVKLDMVCAHRQAHITPLKAAVGWARFCAHAVAALVSAWAHKTCPPYNCPLNA